MKYFGSFTSSYISSNLIEQLSTQWSPLMKPFEDRPPSSVTLGNGLPYLLKSQQRCRLIRNYKEEPKVVVGQYLFNYAGKKWPYTQWVCEDVGCKCLIPICNDKLFVDIDRFVHSHPAPHPSRVEVPILLAEMKERATDRFKEEPIEHIINSSYAQAPVEWAHLLPSLEEAKKIILCELQIPEEPSKIIPGYKAKTKLAIGPHLFNRNSKAKAIKTNWTCEDGKCDYKVCTINGEIVKYINPVHTLTCYQPGKVEVEEFLGILKGQVVCCSSVGNMMETSYAQAQGQYWSYLLPSIEIVKKNFLSLRQREAESGNSKSPVCSQIITVSPSLNHKMPMQSTQSPVVKHNVLQPISSALNIRNATATYNPKKRHLEDVELPISKCAKTSILSHCMHNAPNVKIMPTKIKSKSPKLEEPTTCTSSIFAFHECDKCWRMYPLQKQLTLHKLWTHQKLQRAPKLCSYCQREYKTNSGPGPYSHCCINSLKKYIIRRAVM